jgi:hypothetical protein
MHESRSSARMIYGTMVKAGFILIVLNLIAPIGPH